MDVMTSTRRGPKAMTDSHKAALEAGRKQGRVVREYLDSLKATKRGPGRWRSADALKARLAEVEVNLVTASPFDELLLRQERTDLSKELAATSGRDHQLAEEAFVKVAAEFSDRRGILYATWREVGVPAAVLSKAGITR